MTKEDGMPDVKDPTEKKTKTTIKKAVIKVMETTEEKTKKIKIATIPRKKIIKEHEPVKKKTEEIVTTPTKTPKPEAIPVPETMPVETATDKPLVVKAKSEVVKKVVVERPAVVSYDGTGRRKTSIARVRLIPGKGRIIINGLEAPNYFRHKRLESLLTEPFFATQTTSKFDAVITVKSGGLMSQADAVRHGIAKALLVFDEGLRKSLRTAGLLTRDPRMVERKKYGQSGARKRFQFSKR